ncbi:uncharacterized protein [Saccopteryx bilineata]|uniref:uncharacterized protein n=1 Tax=Saccopteryx bilineata TaxID=59482 RepID=UPI00338FC286
MRSLFASLALALAPHLLTYTRTPAPRPPHAPPARTAPRPPSLRHPSVAAFPPSPPRARGTPCAPLAHGEQGFAPGCSPERPRRPMLPSPSGNRFSTGSGFSPSPVRRGTGSGCAPRRPWLCSPGASAFRCAR